MSAVVLGAACSVPSKPRPASHAARGRAAAKAISGGGASLHHTIVHAGVPVQRLVLPGQAFHPTCWPRTQIGTATTPRVVARTRPDPGAPAIASFPRVNEQGARQVFDLLSESRTQSGDWYKALLPMRPNDTLGYVLANRVHVQWTDYWVLVQRSAFRLTLYQACRAVGQFPVGIGTGSTPTPVGVFFLQSLLQPPNPNGVYGEYAYGLSGYSSVIHDWRWGGLVGLHGTNDPSGIGHVVSHGCVRMLNQDIARLVRVLPLGTPIAIV